MTGETFTQLIMAIITVLSILISAMVVPWLKAKINTEELTQLEAYIMFAVRCANQIFSTEEFKQKKVYVMEYIRNIVDKKLSIDLTEEQIDTIVEAIVNEVKHENI